MTSEWKMAPVEPTPEMCRAANGLATNRNRYAAMLAEAPQPPALGGEPDFELVEPVAPWFYFVECDDPDYSGLFNHESEAQTQANDHGGSVIKLWNVPPTWKPAKRSNADFWQWLDSAYRDGSKGEHAHFTKYNMEVAYEAGHRANAAPLLAEIEEIKEECESRMRVIENVKAERDTLKAENESLDASYETVHEVMARQRTRVAELETERDRLKTRNVRACQVAIERSQQKKAADAEVIRLKSRCEVLGAALSGMVEYFPEGRSDGECFSVETAKAVLNKAAPAAKDGE